MGDLGPEEIAALIALAKKQAEENKKLKRNLQVYAALTAQKGSPSPPRKEVVDLAGGSNSSPPRRRSPRLKNKQNLLTPKKEGTKLKRSLSFEEAMQSIGTNSAKKRRSKPKKVRKIRKKLLPLLSPLQDDVMEGEFWDEDEQKLDVT